jgi:hypothetical protein
MFRSDGGVEIDAVSVRSNADGSDEYLQEGSLVLRLNAEDIITSGEDADVHDSVNIWGRRERVIETEATDIDDAITVAKQYMLRAGKRIPNPSITLQNDDRVIRPYHIVRFLGQSVDRWIQTPVVRLRHELSEDNLTTTIDQEKAVPTLEDLFRRSTKHRGQRNDVITSLRSTTTRGAIGLTAPLHLPVETAVAAPTTGEMGVYPKGTRLYTQNAAGDEKYLLNEDDLGTLSGFDVNTILTDENGDVMCDENGNVMVFR